MKEQGRIKLAFGLAMSLMFFALAGWESRRVLGLIFGARSAATITSSNLYWLCTALVCVGIGFCISFLTIRNP
jgi:hypothetical protein